MFKKERINIDYNIIKLESFNQNILLRIFFWAFVCYGLIKRKGSWKWTPTILGKPVSKLEEWFFYNLGYIFEIYNISDYLSDFESLNVFAVEAS